MSTSYGVSDERISKSLALAALTLARRFASGATMWCASPEWSAHGSHVAVEFVHPVIVGKRSLPAVLVDLKDPVSRLRVCTRPGDVLLITSSAEDATARDLMRRSEAWGLTRFWIGAGQLPPSGSAEHMIWQEDIESSVAARSGDIVVLYHLLWELTHVVFEHPGLLEEETSCTEEVCITCSDQGKVAEVRGLNTDGTAAAVVAGSAETIDVTLLEPVEVGDLVLVHAGVALAEIRS
jgi:hydrogenase maturation factor